MTLIEIIKKYLGIDLTWLSTFKIQKIRQVPFGQGRKRFSKRSLNNLKDVHPDLVKVVTRALEISEQDFTVIEGVRSVARQRELYANGFSKTLNSRHLTGHAVDIVPFPIQRDWKNFKQEQWKEIYKAMKQASKELGVPVTHGYDWGWDKPHHELTWSDYPK